MSLKMIRGDIVLICIICFGFSLSVDYILTMYWMVRWSVTFPRLDDDYLICERDPPSFGTVTRLDHDANDERDQKSNEKAEY